GRRAAGDPVLPGADGRRGLTAHAPGGGLRRPGALEARPFLHGRPIRPPGSEVRSPMKRPRSPGRAAPAGATQRQLRAGELVRHALVDTFPEEETAVPALAGVSVTVTAVRMSPDLRRATVFAEPLGGEHYGPVVEALNRHAKFIRGRLGRLIDMRF